MSQSRLRRSYKSRLKSLRDVSTFCDAHEIPYATDFHTKTQPTATMKDEFAAAYAVPPLATTDLPEKGMSTMLVFEAPAEGRQHGEMVASVADRVGNNLEKGIETLYIKASAYHASRKAFQPELLESVDALIRNQGVPVIHTSMGWNDSLLDFDHGFNEQSAELWNATAFVVISTGNNGRYGESGNIETPTQKHTSASHVPPLVVHVGAAAKDAQGDWKVEGYSSANGPALVAPVAPDKRALWKTEGEPQALIGTSLAAPYISGVLGALNRRYGPYLTREQILYAVLATCSPVDEAAPFEKKTPHAVSLDYITNAARLKFNPDYAGFGLVDPHKADLLLSHMVAQTQKNPAAISVPVEERVRVDIPAAAPDMRDDQGNYIYEIPMPPGIALKTTIDLEFADHFGDVALISPAGTKVPLVTSRLASYQRTVAPFAMSTTQAFLGEKLEGNWRVVSSQKLTRMQMNQHHFMPHDLVADLDIDELLSRPRPALADAVRLTDLSSEHSHYWREQNTLDFSGMTVGGEKPAVDSYVHMAAQLQALPSAFKERRRVFSPLPLIPSHTPAGKQHIAANHHPQDTLEHSLKKADMYRDAAQAYHYAGDEFNEALALGKAAHQYLYFIPTSLDDYAATANQCVGLLEEAILKHQTAGRTDLALLLIDDLYTSHAILWRHATHGGDTNAADNAAAAMRAIRHQHQNLWNQYLGGPDPGAHRIEEGEMGFSDKERMGTDNVWPCITIIARDPETKKTGLAHLDNQADLQTMEKFFANFGSNRLDVRLIGANSLRSPHSKQNIEAVMKYLTMKNVNIVSADILGGPAGAAALVVDPETFEVSEHVPAKATVNADIGNAALLFTKQHKPLVTQFDYTQSKDRKPIFLNATTIKRIREDFLPKSEAELDAYFRAANYTNRPRVVEHLLGLIHAYQNEWTSMSEAIELVITKNDLSEADANRARAALDKQRFFVGENARAANAPIYDWIEHALVRGGKLQLAAIQGVRLDDQPHRLSFTQRAMATDGAALSV